MKNNSLWYKIVQNEYKMMSLFRIFRASEEAMNTEMDTYNKAQNIHILEPFLKMNNHLYSTWTQQYLSHLKGLNSPLI